MYWFNGPVPTICSIVKPVGGVVLIHQVVRYYILLYVVVSVPVYWGFQVEQGYVPTGVFSQV